MPAKRSPSQRARRAAKQEGGYSDPTMVAFEGLYVPENGDLSPAYAPFVGTLPPATERGFRQGQLRGAEGSRSSLPVTINR